MVGPSFLSSVKKSDGRLDDDDDDEPTVNLINAYEGFSGETQLGTGDSP